jgi:hypothetical protein
MLQRPVLKGLFALWIVSTALAPARASLLAGQAVRVTYLFPDTSTIFAGPVDVAGPAGALTNFAGFANLALSDTNILITADRNAQINNVAFDGLEFLDLNGNIPNFTSVTLDGATNYAGFDSSRVTTSVNTIFVNLADLPGLQSQVISLDIGSAAVPEPNSGILAGTALLTVLLASLRKALPEVRVHRRILKRQSSA